MSEDIQKYIRCMEEIKLRDEVIENHLTGECTTGQLMTNIEFICLQFRKIGELIMLSALCVHRPEYQKIKNNIASEWDATKIRTILERIHPQFYPIPFERVVDRNTGKEVNKRVTGKFLSMKECISLIGRCGRILHAFNPYNDNKHFKDVETIKNIFPEWQGKIRMLLKTHEIKLCGANKQLWVYMAHGPENQVLVEERVPVESRKVGPQAGSAP